MATTPRSRARAQARRSVSSPVPGDDGLRPLLEAGLRVISVPLHVLGSLFDRADGSFDGADGSRAPAPRPPAEGFRAPAQPEREASLLDPLIALARIAIHTSETLGRALGGRAVTPAAPGAPAQSAARGGVPPARVVLSPIASVVYLVRDLAHAFERGIERTATRLRRRRR